MPVYLLHGFRWPREGFTGIRVHAVVHNLEDCSVEYIQNANSRRDILGSFRKAYPELMSKLDRKGSDAEKERTSALELIEQHDPNDLSSAHAVSQAYAYVADKVIAIADGNENTPLSVNVEDVIAATPAASPEAWEAFADLRDKIAQGEKIGWWVVYNGDPDRSYDSDGDENDDDDSEEEEIEEEGASTPTQLSASDDGRTAPKRAYPAPPPPPLSSSSEATSTSALPHRVASQATLPEPKQEWIPEPAKLKEASQKSGFRRKFFGRKS